MIGESMNFGSVFPYGVDRMIRTRPRIKLIDFLDLTLFKSALIRLLELARCSSLNASHGRHYLN